MSLTIRSSKFANAEGTAIMLDTVEFGAVLRSERDSSPKDWRAALDSKPAAYEPPAPAEDPIEKLRAFLEANPDVAVALGRL